MAKQKQQVKPRYHYFCHNCKSVYNLDALVLSCNCKSNVLTITDHFNMLSGYYIKGVRQ